MIGLSFYQGTRDTQNLEYQSSLRKSDHVSLEFRLEGSPEETKNEDYKDRIYNYSKGHFVEIRKYFKQTD